MKLFAPLDFIVIGLPRSGTTWLANWLTTERSLCLHDPFALGWPEQWQFDARQRGISCTGAYTVKGFMEQYDCPVAIIDRDPAVCDASLEKIGFPSVAGLRDVLLAQRGKVFAFDALWQESGARTLWNHLLPGVRFDPLRYRLLQDIQVQPHMGKWQPCPSVMEELIGRDQLQLRRA